jgi:hypothetical protein
MRARDGERLTAKEYQLLDIIVVMQALQLVDSELESTRRYWRKEILGYSDEVAADPRPMKQVLGSWPDWRNPVLADLPRRDQK